MLKALIILHFARAGGPPARGGDTLPLLRHLQGRGRLAHRGRRHRPLRVLHVRGVGHPGGRTCHWKKCHWSLPKISHSSTKHENVHTIVYLELGLTASLTAKSTEIAAFRFLPRETSSSTLVVMNLIWTLHSTSQCAGRHYSTQWIWLFLAWEYLSSPFSYSIFRAIVAKRWKFQKNVFTQFCIPALPW